MDYRAFCNDFNNETEQQLIKLSELIHNLYNTRADIIQCINEFAEYYAACGINYDKINDPFNTAIIHINVRDKAKTNIKLDVIKASYIKAYNRLTLHIAKTNKRIKIYSALRNIDQDLYHFIMRSINFEAVNHMILGGTHSFGGGMSTMNVAMTKYDPTRLNVDWVSSLAIRKEILSRNGIPKNKKNPDGEPWLIYFEPVNLPRFKWNKWNIKAKNREYYRFNASKISNGHKLDEIDYTTKRTAINYMSLSPIRRLFIVFNNFKDVVEEYWRNTKYFNWNQDMYSREDYTRITGRKW